MRQRPGEETGDWIYDHISFYGPIMAIRTQKVGIFDIFARFSLFFRIYGTLGVLMVILVSIFFTISLFHLTPVYADRQAGTDRNL